MSNSNDDITEQQAQLPLKVPPPFNYQVPRSPTWTRDLYTAITTDNLAQFKELCGIVVDEEATQSSSTAPILTTNILPNWNCRLCMPQVYMEKQKQNVFSRSYLLMPPLYMAIRHASMNIFNYLLDNVVRPQLLLQQQESSSGGAAAVMTVVENGKMLNVNALSSSRYSCIDTAAWKNSLEMVTRLHEHGASITQSAGSGENSS